METFEKPTNEMQNQWHDDPANWKLGIFYFNKKDKRLWVPKRIKALGFTINFANDWSIMMITALILFIVVVATLKK
jgi:uncharacterized membrane protein